MEQIVRKLNLKVGTIALMLLATFFTAYGKQIPTVTGILQNGPSFSPLVSVSSNTTISTPPLLTSVALDYDVRNTVSLKYNLNTDTFFLASAVVIVTVTIDRKDFNNVALTSLTRTLIIDVNNRLSWQMREQSSVNLTGGYEVKMTITGIKVNGVSKNTLPRYVYLESEINIDRYYEFTSSTNTEPINNPITQTDNDCDGITDEVTVSWSMPSSAVPEEYQLEWFFVSNYSSTGTSVYPTSAFSTDFKNNSTRVTTTDNSYKVSLVYPNGYIVFRVRAVGRDYTSPTQYMYSPWNLPDQSVISSIGSAHKYTITGHDPLKNWQYSSTYAEEGKKKEVISYFDGSLRNRQTVTKINTDDNVIIGETLYDYQGRPAVNVLPVPIVFPSCTLSKPAIRYHENFNINDAGTVYSKGDFDKDNTGSNCDPSVAPMDTASGASQYYSNNNPTKNGQQAFVPHANKFPFTQTEFTPDNTGRIRTQSGVGINHSLGSGKETKYLYGQPNQIQVDRLFGSEAGAASHYKKSIVTDANGQVSVTYMNQEGQTIATGLAGVPPSISSSYIVDSLEYANKNQLLFTVDLFNTNSLGQSDVNTIPSSYDQINFSTQLLVPYRSQYDFDYNLQVDTLGDPCLRPNICVNCVYDLQIQIKDECGINLVTGPYSNTVTGNVSVSGGSLVFNTNCQSPTYQDQTGFTLVLDPGVYTVSKTLKVNQQAKNYYLNKYRDSVYNSCFKTLYHFQSQALALIDTMDCYSSCASCVAELGTKDNYVSTGKGTAEQWELAVEQCNEPCRIKTLCEITYETMLTDVSPGGQYGRYNTSTYDASAEPISVFNTSNILAPNVVSFNQAHWKRPMLRMKNGTIHYKYLDENGVRTKVTVTQVSPGVFQPPVSNSSLVYTDNVTGLKYTYPENLFSLVDFIPIWDPGFAKSLVTYHPEFAYYLSCSEQAIKFPGNTLSSDGLDSLLFLAESYSQAKTHGLISQVSPPYTTAPTINIPGMDPFFSNSNFQYQTSANSITGSQTGISMPFNLSSLMTAKMAQYKNVNGTWYTMAQVAAMITRCGNNYGTAAVPATCTNFGMSPFPASINSDTILNREWRVFRQLYFAEKQKLQFQRMDFYAKYRNGTNSSYYGGCNACIGNTNYNPYSSGMMGSGPSSPYLNFSQPCGSSGFTNYAGTIKRFYDPANPGLNTSVSNANLNLYQSTGQCPLAFQLQNFLNGMAGASNLTTNPIDLSLVGEFTPDLYNSVATPPASYFAYSWIPSVSGSVLTANIGTCVISLDISGTAVPNFGSIIGISQLLPASGGGNGDFTAVALYVSGGSTLSANINGTSGCMDIKNCPYTLAELCDGNQYAIDMSHLLGAIKAANLLGSTTPVSISYNANLNPLLTSTIKNILGTPNTNVVYQFVAPDQLTIYDASNPTTKLVFTYLVNPSNVAASITSFNNIICASPNHKYTMDGLNSSNVKIATITGESTKIIGSTTVEVGVGTCDFPEPAECAQVEHKVRKDLEKILNDILTVPSLNANTNLFGMVYFSPVLQSYISSPSNSTSSTYTFSSGSSPNFDTLTIHFSPNGNGTWSNNNCDLKVYHYQNNGSILNFADISYITSLQGAGSPDIAGNYYYFKALATYTPGSGTVTDTIYGHSCLPIKNCHYCSDDDGGGSQRMGNVSQETQDTYTEANISTAANKNAKTVQTKAVSAASPNSRSGGANTSTSTVTSSGNKTIGGVASVQSGCDPNDPCNPENPCPGYTPGYPCNPSCNPANPCDPNNPCPGYSINNPCDPQFPCPNYPCSTPCNPNNPCDPANPCPWYPCGTPCDPTNPCDPANPCPGAVCPPPPCNPSNPCDPANPCPGYICGGGGGGNPPCNPNNPCDPANPCPWYPCNTPCDPNNPCDPNKPCPGYPCSNPNPCNPNNPCDPNNPCPNYPCNPPNGGGNPPGGNNPPGGSNPGGGNPVGPGGPGSPGGNNPTGGSNAPCPGNSDSTFFFPPYTNYDNPCVAQKINLALQNASNAYNQYIDSLTSAFADLYTKHCLNALEHFTYQYVDKEYHHTLYYYDQAGNLVKTIPPEGVEYLPITSVTDPLEQQVISGRTSGQQTVFTAHRMATKYKYNSLNQLIYQAVPDHDKVDICDGINLSGLDTNLVVNAIHFVSPSKGYLCGQIIKAGTINRGYIYTSNDGGISWSQIYGATGANFQKVQYVNATLGFAVSDFGMVFKTTDGGSTWDVLTGLYNPLSGGRYVDVLNDLYFRNNTDGVVGGIQGSSGSAIYYTTNGGDSFSAASSISGIALGDTITGFTYDGAIYVATAKNGAIGKIFSSPNGVTWTKDSVVANNLKRVQFISNSMAYAVGEEGTLMKLNQTISGTPIFQLVPTGMKGDFTDVYFKNATDGIAIIDSVPGLGKIYKTFDGGITWQALSTGADSYNSLNLYDATNHKLIAAGKNGIVARVLLTTAPFGIVKLTTPNTNEVSYADAYDNGSGGVTAIAISNVASEIYTCYDAQNNAPTWLTIQSSSYITPADALFKKVIMQVSSPTSPDTKGILLTTNGKLYSFSRLYNSSTITFAAVGVTPASPTPFFNDITANSQTFGAPIYAFDSNNNKMFLITFSGATASGAGLSNASAIVQSINAIDIHNTINNNQVIMVGNDGHIEYTSNITAAPNITWSNVSLNSIPVAVTRVKAASTNNFLAVGIDGAVWKSFANYTSTGYRRWRLVNSGNTDKLNSLAFDNSGVGFVVANNGRLYKLTSAQTQAPALLNVTSGISAHLTDVALTQGGSAFVTAADGQVLYTSNYVSTLPAALASPASPYALNGVAFKPSGPPTVVGNNVFIGNFSGPNLMVTKEIFSKQFISTNFFDANNGYVIDSMDVIRKTADGGLNWSVVIPGQGKKITKVVATQANAGALVGLRGYVAIIAGNSVNGLSLPGTITAATTHFYDINYDALKTTGFIVGSNTRAVRINGSTLTDLGTSASNTATFMAVHVFNSTSFIAAGTKGMIYYYNGSFIQQTSYPPPAGLTQNNVIFKDIYFNDNFSGYAVGANSAAYKVNLSSNSPISSAGTSANALSWQRLCAVGVNLGYTTSGQLQQLDFRTMACSSSSSVMIGGSNANVTVAGFGPVEYARLLQEETGNNAFPITKFWYDKLGRLILSQNPKQVNKVNPINSSVTKAYSYTLYDALGRVIEVGEKFENHVGGHPKFSSIFGSIVGGTVNPIAIDDDKFQTWVLSSGPRREVTKTYYDEQTIFTLTTQNNLRKRVASVTYETLYDGNNMTYNHATHYSYDIHGNVSRLWQENPDLSVSGQTIKRIDYDYDLISGKVNKVTYSPGELDQFIHRYAYDADNRIVKVETSRDGMRYDLDAKYFYYAHGPLARIEYGKAQVQGVDYAYTIQGWIKGVNSNTLKKSRDMGRDGDNSFANPNGNFAKDISGYTLNYYQGDYAAIDYVKWNSASTRFEAYTAGSDLSLNSSSLYNGNISSMVTAISKIDTSVLGKVNHSIPLPMGNSYRYDQLNRIKRSWSYENMDTINDIWLTNNASKGLYRNTFTYDANGNLLKQVRRDSVRALMDSLTYTYETNTNGKLLRNRLYHVRDSATGTSYGYDIIDQGSFNPNNINSTNNYGYDELGNLVRDNAEDIQNVEWTVYGKIKSITRSVGGPKSNLSFDYDAMGNRIAKHVSNSNGLLQSSTYYLRDAQGNVLSVYEKTQDPITSTTSYKQRETHIYGSSRLGMAHLNFEMIGANPPPGDTTKYYLGNKSYELSNHLGNVLAMISDKKVAIDNNNDKVIDSYVVDLASASDYYPFGMEMPGRRFDRGGYRYGFNGQEKDDEVKGSGNELDFGFRAYDPRLGRFMAVDPLAEKYPMYTPYAFAANQPIHAGDLEGLENPDDKNPTATKENGILKANGSVVTTTDQNPPGGTTQFAPQPVTQLPPLNLAGLSGSNSDKAQVVANHFLNVMERQYSDPTSAFNTTGQVPVNQIFSNIGTSSLPLNTDIATMYGVSKLPITLNLGALTGAPGEAINLPTMFTSNTPADGLSSTQSVNFNTNTGTSVVLSARNAYSKDASGKSQLKVADGTSLQIQVGARLNHGLILRDKIIIWNNRAPALYKPYYNGAKLNGVGGVGARLNNQPGLIFPSDGGFTH